MHVKRLLTSLGWAACLALSLPGSALAQSIASKVESLGEMKYLKVTGMRAAFRDGFLTVQAEVTNTDNTNQTLYYRFKWRDADGFEVWGEEPWKTQIVYGMQKVNLQMVAPTTKATDFSIEVQSPENTTSTFRSNPNSTLSP